jgi:hypothetical protein
LVGPSLAITGASLDARSEEADDLLARLELRDNVTIAPLNGVEQAARLAEVIARTGLDPCDAHVAAIADVAICPQLRETGKPRRLFEFMTFDLMVELRGFEPLTFCMPCRRATSCAIAPCCDGSVAVERR